MSVSSDGERTLSPFGRRRQSPDPSGWPGRFFGASLKCLAEAHGALSRRMSGSPRPGGVMRFLVAPQYYQEMLARTDHTPDCYVRPGEFPHHLYIDGVKYTVAQAV